MPPRVGGGEMADPAVLEKAALRVGQHRRDFAAMRGRLPTALPGSYDAGSG